MGRPLGPASRPMRLLVATTFVALTALATAARAETPGKTEPPPAAASPAAATAPSAPSLTPAPAAGLEAGDTAPPGAVEPLGQPAPGAPMPGAVPSLATAGGPYAPVPKAPPHRPFYQRAWFWGLVGVVVVTCTYFGVVALQPVDPTKPTTRLGDMRAF